MNNTHDVVNRDMPGSADQQHANGQDSEKTYEMQWDCPFCGAKKLLGLTHRHCPNCGAPQDPSRRYFPREEDKVAVQDHTYVGADVICPACQTANARVAKHCGGCGGPLGEGRDVALVPQQVVGQASGQGGAPGYRPASPQVQSAQNVKTGKTGKSTKLIVGCGCGFLILVVLAIVAFFVINSLLKKDAAFQVQGHSWRHEIPVEVYKMTQRTSGCGSMPAGAERVRRTKVAPVCTTKRVDQGDGTFKEVRDCKDKGDQCSYYVGEWTRSRVERQSGNSSQDNLTWPEVKLGRTGKCEGCERLGARKAIYTVKFKDLSGGKPQECNFNDVNKWRSFAIGSSWKGKTGGLTGNVDCDSLQKR